ncbi:MAG TPA: hypothetical protein VLK25_11620 [Allosphingosinicella sp.]|nr:hypothetical protein [Allosphingosinicella sp.]
MRLAPAALLLLAACSGEPGDQTTNSAAAPAKGQPDRRIECRGTEAEPFARTCSMETFDSNDGRLVTVRKPDGGFRRLRVSNDGRGIVAADGAEQVTMANLRDGRILVSIGDDHFRLPGTVLRP